MLVLAKLDCPAASAAMVKYCQVVLVSVSPPVNETPNCSVQTVKLAVAERFELSELTHASGVLSSLLCVHIVGNEIQSEKLVRI